MDSENFDIVDYTAMGKRIRQTRKLKKMTQEELARQIGVSTSYIGHIERGIKKCSLGSAAAICVALDMDADVMIFGKTGRVKPVERDRAVVSEFLRKTLAALEEFEE